ncbi:DUF2911 domain-containing protein [Planktosalinus lacus]|uniref:DUF2911 domain-containing protein n=1 Tax=Planktosalinus lacus TaxID=1526573 RepID=A0A8J2VFR0_9FLAO|nr:DUF2911 domain-containing protein [Planktosalinus lacus]GGE01146.1 hypothetical protein GCM10011312_25760 [Planktosalinus lacus]
MKLNYIKTSLLFLFIFTSFTSLEAQEFPSLDASPLDITIVRNDDMSPVIRVIYSRPKKNDREIFGALVPFEKIWRTGANEATELEIYEPLKLGSEIIEKGTYTLYTIPKKDEWTVILNRETNVWGAYNYKEELDIVRIDVPSKSAAATIESLSMAFMPTENGVSLMIGWDDRFIEVPFEKVK